MLCAATLSNSYIKRRLCYVMLRFVAVTNRVIVPAPQAAHSQPGGIGLMESIFGLLISLKIRALYIQRI
jgi:hypothetical protein